VVGWWRDRAGREHIEKKARYALIVSLKSQNVDIDLYTPIKTSAEIPVEIETWV
jgi:hypothetical protein